MIAFLTADIVPPAVKAQSEARPLRLYEASFTIEGLTPDQIDRLTERIIELVEQNGGSMGGGFVEIDRDGQPAGIPFGAALRCHWLEIKHRLGLILHLIVREVFDV